MPRILQDIRHAIRFFRRTPGFTATAILVLALGIGANTAVFSLVNALLLKPLPGRVGEMLGLFNRDRTKPDTYSGFSYPAYVDLRDNADVFEGLMAQSFSFVGVKDGEATRRAFASIVSANFFSAFGVHLPAGRSFSAEEERPGSNPRVVVASWDVWRRAGYAPGFVGSAVHINGVDYTVVGVAPRGFSGTMAVLAPDWWFPLGVYEQIVGDIFKEKATGLTDRANPALVLVGILKPGVSRDVATARLDQMAHRLEEAYPGTDKERAFILSPLRRMGVSTSPGDKDSLGVLSALLLTMSGLVLLVACMNLANLLLARSAARRKEIAIRLALGGGRGRILQQLLTEGLLLSLAGACFGLFIAWWTTSLLTASLTAVFPFSLTIEAVPDVRVVAAAIGFAVLSTLFFAAGPAWALSRQALVSDLKADTYAPNSAQVLTTRLTSGPILVIGQLAVSVALVAAGGLFVRGALKVATADPGFAVDHQLVVAIDAGMGGYDEARGRAVYRTMLDRVRALPGVQDATLASTVPFGEFTEGRTVRRGGRTESQSANFVIVGGDYFKTLGLSLQRGREFTRAEEEGAGRVAGQAVIDEPLARKMFGTDDPIGQIITMPRRESDPAVPLEIIGVAPGLRHDLFSAAPDPHVYVAYGGQYRSTMNLHVRVAPSAAGDAAMLQTIRRELQQLDANLPVVSMKTMAMHRDGSIPAWTVRAGAQLFAAFGVLGLLLAAIGVYGLRSYDVSRRRREMGIRMALGATADDVQRLILGEGLKTTTIGLGAGLVLAGLVGMLVSRLLYQVSPLDPPAMLVAAALLGVSALVAAWLPARQATRVAPMEALRAD